MCGRAGMSFHCLCDLYILHLRPLQMHTKPFPLSLSSAFPTSSHVQHFKHVLFKPLWPCSCKYVLSTFATPHQPDAKGRNNRISYTAVLIPHRSNTLTQFHHLESTLHVVLCL